MHRRSLDGLRLCILGPAKLLTSLRLIPLAFGMLP